MNFLKRLFGNKNEKIIYAEGDFKVENNPSWEFQGEYHKQDEILATGFQCVAWGKDAKLIPAGICGYPCSEELKIALQKADDEFLFDKKYGYPLKDKIKAIKTNPINKCIFCKNDGLCYFAGDCDKRLSIK